jgi:IS30 family transposase
MPHNNKSAVNERRQKLWTLLTKGMKGYEIARALDTNQSTVSRDIKFLTAQSQDYLNSLAKETLSFMYQTLIEGIRDVIRECYTIYLSQDSRINMYHKLAALKLIKECHESVFHLLEEGSSVLATAAIKLAIKDKELANFLFCVCS